MTMSLFETLAIKNGTVLNPYWHNVRFKKGQIFLNRKFIIDDITTLIKIPSHVNSDKLIRCRVIYDTDDIKVEYFDYMPKAIRSFKLIECNYIDYQYKYNDRTLLNELLSQKGDCDEIMIIKNGFITDCSIGNLLFLKDGIWYTPDTPLLQGTQREYLLDTHQIKLARILKNDICNYEKVMMINALNGFNENRAIPISDIKE